MEQGTGSNTCEAVYSLLEDWNVSQDIVALCYDTTAVNTGPYAGAHVLLEAKLNRKLLALPCRHHILELHSKAAFTASFGTSSAPTVLIFARFQKYWENIDQTKFEHGIKDDFIRCNMNIDEIADFCHE